MIKTYIESGILETYVLGSASEDEVQELLYMKTKYPEVNEALEQLEIDMEKMAMHMAMMPPPSVWNKIEQEINDLIPSPDAKPTRYKERNGYQEYRTPNNNNGQQFIEVESESSHMRIHKSWKMVFAAVFVLGKIFLGFAIYFYLENRQAQQQLQELKTEMRQLKK